MTPERWQAIQSVFDAALEVPFAHRGAYLATACEGDKALKEEVLSLLTALGEAPAFFDGLAQNVVHPTLQKIEEGGDNPVLAGPYRIVQLLGRGGMGSVYLAERDDGQFSRQVAVKVVQQGATPEGFQRFMRERQILANLKHPHIAQLFDGGLLPDGRPYLVMEYVEGKPITEYCDTQRLSVNDRLHLFRAAAEAVQYAHRNLVVHRDLKPSNILVTAAGEVKLLDFGIAKLLEDDPGQGGAVETIPYLTPAYASPEQVAGQAISTASDVYQLGVLLYELLTGRRPFELPERLRHEAMRVIVDEAPERPSTVVTQPVPKTAKEQTQERISQTRGVPLRVLQRRLVGDLDNIILMALRKEAERRYGSVAQFVDDIERHLEGQPVSARPATLAYRIRKFTQRHRYTVIGASVFLLTLVGYAATLTWQAQRITEERDLARLESEKANQVAGFLVDLFEASDPDVVQDTTLTARAVLRRGARRVHEELHAQPEIQAELLRIIGATYRKLGDYSEAKVLLEQAMGKTPDPPTPTVLVEWANLLTEQGEYAAAEPLFKEALQQQRIEWPQGSPQLATTLSSLATLYRLEGQWETAALLIKEALTLRRLHLGNDHPATLESLHDLAVAEHERGNSSEAKRLFEQTLEAQQKVMGEWHPALATTLNSLGRFYFGQGRYQEAHTYLEEALIIRRAIYGTSHPQVATVLSNLARVATEQGHYNEAVALVQEALDMRKPLLGEAHPRTVASRIQLGTLFCKTQHFVHAEQQFRQALRHVSTDDIDDWHDAQKGLASSLVQQGRYEEALPLLSNVLESVVVQFGAGHRYAAQAMENLAFVELKAGAYDDAIKHYHEALRVWQGQAGEQVRALNARLHVAQALQQIGRLDESEHHHLLALEDAKRTLPIGHIRLASTLVDVGLFYLNDNRAKDAEPYLREAWEQRKMRLPDGHWRIADIQVHLAKSVALLGATQEARELLTTSKSMLATMPEQGRKEREREVDVLLQKLQEADEI